MAIENNVAVYIDGINRTPNVVLPVKYGNYLDERLDECNLSLRLIAEENFSPLTPVEIRIINTQILGSTKNTYEETLYYIVGNDNATEVLIGKGIYNHELYLLEVTKVAECITSDSLCYTNDLGRTYTNNSAYATPFWE